GQFATFYRNFHLFSAISSQKHLKIKTFIATFLESSCEIRNFRPQILVSQNIFFQKPKKVHCRDKSCIKIKRHVPMFSSMYSSNNCSVVILTAVIKTNN